MEHRSIFERLALPALQVSDLKTEYWLSRYTLIMSK